MIPKNSVNNNDWLHSLHLYLDQSVKPVIWITNEIINSIQAQRTLLFEASYFDIRMQKHTILKQPQPYSSCLADLTKIDSYQSECYAKAFSSFNTSYHYTNCVSMCKQKYLGEKCKFQSNLYGPVYFTNMDSLNYNTIYFDSPDDKRNCFIQSSNISSDYLNNCDCPLECQKDLYTFDVSMSNVDTVRKYKEIIIYFEEMTETVISEEVKTRWTDLISNLGGILGLFSGFSFLSIIELVEIGVQAALIYLEEKKKKLRVRPNNQQFTNQNQQAEMNQNQQHATILPKVSFLVIFFICLNIV